MVTPIKHLVLFNGPPRSGKDLATQILLNEGIENGPSRQTKTSHKFAQPIRDMIFATFPYINEHNYDEYKDKPVFPYSSTPQGMMTLRDFMIDYSENFMKAKFGKEIFGKLAGLNCLKLFETHDIIIFSDFGFVEDFTGLINLVYTRYPIVKIQIVHLSRPGKNFSVDSRNYVTRDGIPVIKIENDSTEEHFKQKVLRAVQFE